MNPIDALCELLTESAPHVPLLLAYLAVIVVAAVYRRRYPRPCLLLGLGCGLFLVTAVVQPTLIHFLIRTQADRPSLAMLLLGVSVGATLVHLAGFALVVLAVFADRGHPTPAGGWRRDHDEAPQPAPRVPSSADATGIQEGRP